jgi:uncharacterized coiled-coil protein SlyX
MSVTTSTPSTFPSHGNAYPSHPSPQATAAAALSQNVTGIQQHSPHDGTPTNGNNKKRKATGIPGSRGVANLTPEQLAKKRANDRDAQRAIRERTRNTIANLEARIRELESQQPFQELQRVVAERDAALHECEDLKRRLSAVAQVVGAGAGAQQTQPSPPIASAAVQQQLNAPAGSLNGTLSIDDFIDPTWLNTDEAELAALTAQQAPLPPHPGSSQQVQYAGYSEHVHPDLRSPSYPSQGSPGSALNYQESAAKKWSPIETASQYPATNGNVNEYQLPPPATLVNTTANGERGDRLGLNYIMDKDSPRNGQRAGIGAAEPSTSISPSLSFDRLPANDAPTSPLDSLLKDFIISQRDKLRAGASKLEALGPEYPSFIGLYTPSKATHSSHPVSALLIDILSKFPDISQLPEKVAVLYIMFLVMRWFICPCQECYERLPEWIRPVTEQLEKPHAHWVDNLPWSVSPSIPLPAVQEEEVDSSLDFDLFCGDMRAAPEIDWEELSLQTATGNTTTTAESQSSSQQSSAVDRKDEQAAAVANEIFRPFMRKQLTLTGSWSAPRFEDFFIPYTTTLSLNWTGEAADVFATPSPAGSSSSGEGRDGGSTLSAEFEAHLRDLRNWSLGSAFREAFPELVNEEVRIHDGR